MDAERKPLSGNVEVDEALVGGVQEGGKRGRGATKSIVAIAVEIKQPKGFGRVRMRHIPDASGASLLPFVRKVIAPGSVVLTDGWSGYNVLAEHGYTWRGLWPQPNSKFEYRNTKQFQTTKNSMLKTLRKPHLINTL